MAYNLPRSQKIYTTVGCKVKPFSRSGLGKQTYFPGPAKPPFLLHQIWRYKILQDLKCPKPLQHSIFCNFLHFILQIGLGSTVKTAEEEDEWLNRLISYKDVCRAAPGLPESAKYPRLGHRRHQNPLKHVPANRFSLVPLLASILICLPAVVWGPYFWWNLTQEFSQAPKFPISHLHSTGAAFGRGSEGELATH